MIGDLTDESDWSKACLGGTLFGGKPPSLIEYDSVSGHIELYHMVSENRTLNTLPRPVRSPDEDSE